MYLRNYFALLVIIFSCSLTLTSSEFRVVRGSPWTIEQSPYLVSIWYEDRNRCVGSLVTLEKVLTAANCVADLNKDKFSVAAGVTNLCDIPSIGQTRSVARVIVPNIYNRDTKDMDIALMRLCRPFDKSNTVDTIKFCGTILKGGQDMEISGWGWTTPEDGMTANILQATNLTTITRRTCTTRYTETRKTMSSSMICAAKDRSDACYEDFGGPGVVNRELCAVVSHNPACSNPRYPTVFTTLSNLRVQGFLKKAMAL